MKVFNIVIPFFICFTCFTASAQSDLKTATVSSTSTQSKQNKELKQGVHSNFKTPNSATTNTDAIALKEMEFDFGKIPQGKPVTHIFFFTNTGSTPLSLQNVQASCGCTTPEWSKDAVAPGATSKITVGYNAANLGAFTKSITITYNDNQSKQLNIKGEVWETPATSAPVNSTLESLKDQQ